MNGSLSIPEIVSGSGKTFVAIRGNLVQPAAAFCYGLLRVKGHGL